MSAPGLRVGVEAIPGLLAGVVVYLASDRVIAALVWVGVVVGAITAVRLLRSHGAACDPLVLSPTSGGPL